MKVRVDIWVLVEKENKLRWVKSIAMHKGIHPTNLERVKKKIYDILYGFEWEKPDWEC